MKNIVRKISNKLRRIWYRRNYYRSLALSSAVPYAPLPYIPAGFVVNKIGETGISVIENFVTPDEANYLIETARRELQKSQVIVDGKPVFDSGRTSSHAVLFHRYRQDPRVLPIIARGAMLAGVPMKNTEQVYVSRYESGEFYHGHYDVSDDFRTKHRLCTMLIYLNDLDGDQGGATYFRDLNVAIRPRAGRAVCWTNTNPDGSVHKETLHAALPPEGEGTEKWIIQLWFRPYFMHRIKAQLNPLQNSAGLALKGNETLPSGTWAPTGS